MRVSLNDRGVMAVVHEGREVARLSGVRPASEIERFVTDSLAAETRRAS